VAILFALGPWVGPTVMTLSTGVTHVRGARVVEVSLAGVVKGGPDFAEAAL